MSFGASVRAKRVSEGIGLIEFAKRLGLSPAYWSRVELEREHPPRDLHVEKTAAILGIPLDDLYVEAGRLPPDMRENLREVVRIYRAKRQEWVMRMNAAGLLNARPRRNWHEEIISSKSSETSSPLAPIPGNI